LQSPTGTRSGAARPRHEELRSSIHAWVGARWPMESRGAVGGKRCRKRLPRSWRQFGNVAEKQGLGTQVHLMAQPIKHRKIGLPGWLPLPFFRGRNGHSSDTARSGRAGLEHRTTLCAWHKLCFFRWLRRDAGPY